MKIGVYAKNFFWMAGDKVVALFSALLWSVLLSRSLGVDEFGYYNSIVSLVALLLPLAASGINGVLNKFILTNKNYGQYVLSAFFVKMSFGFLSLVIFYFWIYLSTALSFSESVFLYSLILLLQSFQVLESFNQSFSSSKNVTLARFISIFIFILVKLYFYYDNSLDLKIAFIVQLLEFVFYYFFLILFTMTLSFEKIKEGFYVKEKFVLFKNSKTLIYSGSFLILSGVAESVNLKIDILMLSEMATMKEVSIYSVAVRISESGYFFAMAIATSFFPKMIEAKKSGVDYFVVIREVMKKNMILCFLFIIFISISSFYFISFFYGEVYSNSYYVLLIHMFSSVFIYFRAVFSKWLILEDVLKYSLYTHLLGGGINVFLNLILIPVYGYYGAAIATLFSYFVSSFLSLFFFRDTRVFIKGVFFRA